MPYYFYPRSPCGERQQAKALKIAAHSISIHALLAESDAFSTFSASRTPSFLSTLSLRRATIPIMLAAILLFYFYPRSPCGERQLYINRTAETIIFLSTLSLRRATLNINRPTVTIMQFLSTLSLRRATGCQRPCARPTTDFYPRSPCGERPNTKPTKEEHTMISIHALLAESDHLKSSRG